MYNILKYQIQTMQDEQHYPARVTALGPNTAVVMFTEFNNYEEVSFIHIVQTNFYVVSPNLLFRCCWKTCCRSPIRLLPDMKPKPKNNVKFTCQHRQIWETCSFTCQSRQRSERSVKRDMSASPEGHESALAF